MAKRGTKGVLEYARLAMGFANVRASRYGIRYCSRGYSSANANAGAGAGPLCVGVGAEGVPPSSTNVWARRLSGGRVALVFINVGKEAATVTCGAACLEKTGLAGKSVTVRDLWKHAALAPEPKLGARLLRHVPVGTLLYGENGELNGYSSTRVSL